MTTLSLPYFTNLSIFVCTLGSIWASGLINAIPVPNPLQEWTPSIDTKTCVVVKGSWRVLVMITTMIMMMTSTRSSATYYLLGWLQWIHGGGSRVFHPTTNPTYILGNKDLYYFNPVRAHALICTYSSHVSQ